TLGKWKTAAFSKVTTNAKCSIGPPWHKNTKVNVFPCSEIRRSTIWSGSWALSCWLIGAMSICHTLDPPQLFESDRENPPPSTGNAEVAYRGQAEWRLDEKGREAFTSALQAEEQPRFSGLANLELPPREAPTDEPVEELPTDGNGLSAVELEKEGRTLVSCLFDLEGIDTRQDGNCRGIRLEIASDAGA